MRAETARADAELAAGDAADEIRQQRAKLEAQQERMESMGRMLDAQLVAGHEAQEGERRLRAELSSQMAVQEETLERLQQQAYSLAQQRAAEGSTVRHSGLAAGRVWAWRGRWR